MGGNWRVEIENAGARTEGFGATLEDALKAAVLGRLQLDRDTLERARESLGARLADAQAFARRALDIVARLEGR